MNAEFYAVWFGFSFLTYTLLRRPDEISTSKLAARVDLQKYEVNPTIAWLSKKIGLKKAFLLTWLVIGLSVASADTYMEHVIPLTLPLFALIFGFGHVLAAANNTRVGYLLDRLGPEEFERQHEESMRELVSLPWGGRIRSLFRSNTEAFLISILAVPLSISLAYSLVASDFFIIFITHDVYLVLPITASLAFMLALVLVYPAQIIGPIILALRYGKGKTNLAGGTTTQNTTSVELPISIIQRSLDLARSEGATMVRIDFPGRPTGGE